MNQLDILQRNVANVRSRISDAAKRSGRNSDEVKLIAVTKYVDASVVKDLAKVGLNVFGESRPQVLWEKCDALRDHDFEWHLIGHLQRNKVRRSLPLVKLIHSVDSPRLLKEIARESESQDRVTPVLLEVNISGETNKHGLQEADLKNLVEQSLESGCVQVQGLMGMGGLASSQAETRNQFAGLRELRDRLAAEYEANAVDLSCLSMGMSGDFEWAIEEGATHVRVGSVLFEGLR